MVADGRLTDLRQHIEVLGEEHLVRQWENC